MATVTCWCGSPERDEEITSTVAGLGEVLGQAHWRMPFPAINTLVNTDATVSGIIGTDNPGPGYLRFDPIASTPKTDSGNGFQDITMLSFWGAVVFEGSNTGFAMEFIGDATDSSSHPDMTSGRFPSGVN